MHKLFSQITGMGKVLPMQKLLHAPFTLKPALLALIEQETTHALAGTPAHVIIKVNSLNEPQLMRALYRASIAGVQVDLIVRGICCLRPGIAGVSENIRVRSIIGRFVEHSRAYWFANAGKPQLYLSSADLMERNMDRRIETAFPVTDEKMHARVRHALQLYLDDNSSASVLHADGQYQRLTPPAGAAVMEVQAELLRRLCVAEGDVAH